MATLLDQHGNPIQKEILYEPQAAKLTQLHQEFAQHPSRGLTPARLANILEGAEKGNLMAQAELFADMEEKDGHLYAEMSKRKTAIQSIDWEIRPPRNPSAEEKSLAAYLTELVQDIPKWDTVLFDAFDGIGHGYSCQEVEWQLLGKEWFPKAITHRPPTWFTVNRFDQNDLRLRDNTPNGAQLIPFGWITHKHKAKTSTLARMGLHRILAWPYLFKNYAIGDLAELLEIYGLPIRIGKYPPGTGDAEKATLLRAVTQLGHAAAGIIPESMTIEFESAASGNQDPFETVINWAEKTISKAILGGTLTSQADGKSSTNALGKVHDEVRREILTSDSKQLATTLTSDLLYPLAVLNGKQITDPRRMPHLFFDVREEEDFQRLASALPDLVNIGMQVPMSWVNRKLSIPVRQGDEPLLTPSKSGNSGFPTAANRIAALKVATTDALQSNAERKNDEAWSQVISHIQGLVDTAEDLLSLQNTLLEAYSGLPMEDMQSVMAQGFALAQLAGMFDVKAGR
ncbi:DUF935 domain-containing protein [Undibacterium sp. TJN19]|uniref:DUF935 domain-containing protein n=1 Tax=Undibacterium sp. TJN19 TaxID=3413055 RepID=UPI003BF335E2